MRFALPVSEESTQPDAQVIDYELRDLPCGCQDVIYADGTIDREHDHVECDGQVTPEWRHKTHLMMGDQGRCTENCTHEPYPPCPVCGEPA